MKKQLLFTLIAACCILLSARLQPVVSMTTSSMGITTQITAYEDDSLYLTATDVTDVRTETQQPTLGYRSIVMNPSDIDACDDSTQLTIVMENSGPTDARNVDLVITLPAGLTYNTNTSQSGLSTDSASAIAALGAIGDPAITGGGGTLTWYDLASKVSDLADTVQADGGNDTLVLRFTVQSACYTTDNLDFDLRYYDDDDTQYSETTQQQLTALFPSLTVTKTANLSQVDCGSNVEFTIQVTNNGTGNAKVVRVVDTLGDWLDYAGNFTEDHPGTVTPAIIGGDPQVVGWEFNNLGPGATATFTFDAALNPDGLPNQNDCTAALRQNNVTAQWACGTLRDATDDDPNTTGYDCTDSGTATAGPVTLQMPDLVITNITPTISCSTDGNFGGSIVVAVENQGDEDSNDTFTVQVTDGKGWSGTGTHSGSIASGNSVDVTINTGAWVPDCHACDAPYSFDATVDLNDDVCECNETNNTFGPVVYTAPIPDLTIHSTVTPSTICEAGILRGVFTATVGNTGCGDANDAVARLTSDCDLGASDQTIDLTAQSSQEVTFSFTITRPSRTCAFTTTVDPDNGVAECSGINNSLLTPYDFLCFPPVGGISERPLLGAIRSFQYHNALYLPTRLRDQ